jgi:hypothetical protein
MVGARVWRKVGPVTAAERQAALTPEEAASPGTPDLAGRRTLPILE